MTRDTCVEPVKRALIPQEHDPIHASLESRGSSANHGHGSNALPSPAKDQGNDRERPDSRQTVWVTSAQDIRGAPSLASA